jgi:hypothetical protein
MSARYQAARLPLSRRQLTRMAAAARSGAPLGLVLGTGSDAVEIDVILTPKQIDSLNGGARRIKFSPSQLKKMSGAGVFSALGDMATPLAEEGISAGLNAVAPGLGEVAGPILGEMVGPLIDKVAGEIDYAISKKPNFKQLSKNRAAAEQRARRYAAADESERAADYARMQQTFARAPKFMSRAVPKTQAAYESRLAKNLNLETNEDKIKSAHKAAFMEKLKEGSGRRMMTPAQRSKLSGGALGKQAADYIRAEITRAAKN